MQVQKKAIVPVGIFTEIDKGKGRGCCLLGGGEKKRKERDGGNEFLYGAPTSRVLKWRRFERANEQSFAIGLGLQLSARIL